MGNPKKYKKHLLFEKELKRIVGKESKKIVNDKYDFCGSFTEKSFGEPCSVCNEKMEHYFGKYVENKTILYCEKCLFEKQF